MATFWIIVGLFGLHVVPVFSSSWILNDDFFPPKAWWANKLTSDLYTAGRLASRQVKYAHEVGFQSIISVYNFTQPYDQGGTLDGLVTDDALKLVLSIGGMTYEYLLMSDQKWMSVEAINIFTIAFKRVNKPVLLHCNTGYSSTFIALGYLATESQITVDQFWEMAALLGFDYYKSTEMVNLVSLATAQHLTRIIPEPRIRESKWYQETWWLKPIYIDWHISGQIQRNHVLLLKDKKFQSVVNVRIGVTSQVTGLPAQEEVTLLNIKDGTGTYEGILPVPDFIV